MSGAWELLAFAGVMVLGQFSPGPDMILLTRTALKAGARTGVEMAMGIACGLAVHATLAVGGLALAFERLPILQVGLRWAAAIYLMWLAWRMLGEFRTAGDSGGALEVKASSSARNPFLRGLLCNLLNPKAALFIAAVSAPFLSRRTPRLVADRVVGNRGCAGVRPVVACGRICCNGVHCVRATKSLPDGSTWRSERPWRRWQSCCSSDR